MEAIKSKEITATELARNLADYLNRVAYRGEQFTIVRNGKPLGELRPLSPTGTAKDLIEALNTLEEWPAGELDAFARDVEEARRLGNRPQRDPWEE